MAITIVETAGASTANSFVSVVEADAYIEARLNSSLWTGTEPKKQALVEATRELSVMNWAGNTVTTTQALAWPRQWVCNPDSPNSDYYASTVIPQRVKDACCELALQFLKAGTTDIAMPDPNAEVKVKTIDVLTTEYFDSYQRPKGLSRFPRVMTLIRPLLASAAFSFPVVRG